MKGARATPRATFGHAYDEKQMLAGKRRISVRYESQCDQNAIACGALRVEAAEIIDRDAGR